MNFKTQFIFLLFFYVPFSAQEIAHKEGLKKCRKEFSKKICLSDEDQDSLLFYIDKCPKENGPVKNLGCPWPDSDKDGIIDKDDACPAVKGEVENNGCPWPDTDGDGILDKDDACSTIPGVHEDNGCPERGDCTEYFQKEKKELSAFKERNSNEKQKFVALRKIIFNNVSKIFLVGESIYVSIYVDTFINDHYTVKCSSRSSLYHDKKLFLDQLFWSEDTFEYVAKKLNKNLIPTIGSGRKTIISDYLIGFKRDLGYYDFFETFCQIKDPYNKEMIYYYPRNKQKLKFDGSETRLIINFSQYEAENKVVVKFYKLRDEYFYTYQYTDNQWKLINTEKQKY